MTPRIKVHRIWLTMEDNGFSAAHTRLFHPSDNSICLSEGRSGRRGKSNDWFTWREREKKGESFPVRICVLQWFSRADMYVRGKQHGFLESTFLSCTTESYNLLLTRVEAAVDALNLFLLNLVRFCGPAQKSRL